MSAMNQDPMTTLTLLAHVSGAPHNHAEGVTIFIIALGLLALMRSWRKTA